MLKPALCNRTPTKEKAPGRYQPEATGLSARVLFPFAGLGGHQAVNRGPQLLRRDYQPFFARPRLLSFLDLLLSFLGHHQSRVRLLSGLLKRSLEVGAPGFGPGRTLSPAACKAAVFACFTMPPLQSSPDAGTGTGPNLDARSGFSWAYWRGPSYLRSYRSFPHSEHCSHLSVRHLSGTGRSGVCQPVAPSANAHANVCRNDRPCGQDLQRKVRHGTRFDGRR